MSEVPEELLNVQYNAVKQDGLDEFLTVRGVPWLVRKLITGKLTKNQFLMKKKDDGSYEYHTGDPSKNLVYNFKLGETFEATGYDGKKHRITITTEGGKLRESHVNLERDVGEDVFFYFIQGGVLVSTCKTVKDGKEAVWKTEYAKK